MGTKIIKEQKERILFKLKIRNIPEKVILNMLNINNLDELNVVQYNYLLLLLESRVTEQC